MKKERGWLDHDHQRPLMAMQEQYGYGERLNDTEMMVIDAFRSATEAQRSVVISWAKANSPSSKNESQDHGRDQ